MEDLADVAIHVIQVERRQEMKRSRSESVDSQCIYGHVYMYMYIYIYVFYMYVWQGAPFAIHAFLDFCRRACLRLQVVVGQGESTKADTEADSRERCIMQSAVCAQFSSGDWLSQSMASGSILGRIFHFIHYIIYTYPPVGQHMWMILTNNLEKQMSKDDKINGSSTFMSWRLLTP